VNPDKAILDQLRNEVKLLTERIEALTADLERAVIPHSRRQIESNLYELEKRRDNLKTRIVNASQYQLF
jgi:ElaB/YqjD/DUF883 family membrane-anchored ribosome-binding protein